ncbi:DgyrCDS10025 [Dimorphilus gyrociliatus]|uniref:DgyrCDS10025 n=1 Tax=Dimorphilus gyrociliatus TaxID=2664684 RepID=A0A7I8W045_9ANNE|nr:DgyrCDS10025 [Dimorphilus gyrociliatus]
MLNHTDQICRWKDVNLKVDNPEVMKAYQSRLMNFTNTREPFENVGKEDGLRIWQIRNYRIFYWPETEYGNFYEDNAYIILSSTSPEVFSEEIVYDIHIWIGKRASYEDYVVSVLALNILDEKLRKTARLHREIQGRESDLFTSYFQPISFFSSKSVWKGGFEQSFARTRDKSSYEYRLLRFYKPKDHTNNIKVKEVAAEKAQLTSDFVYILDMGTKFCIWNGRNSANDHRIAARNYIEEIKANRGAKIKVDIIDEIAVTFEHYFYTSLVDGLFASGIIKDEDDEFQSSTIKNYTKAIYSVNPSTDPLSFTPISAGQTASLSTILANDVTIFDTQQHCFILLSQSASAFKRKAIEMVHHYLRGTQHPLIPVTILIHGQRSAALERFLLI